MKYMKKCENCIWSEQCGQETACDGYEPASAEEQEKMSVMDYESDLRERHTYYQEQIDEQNS